MRFHFLVPQKEFIKLLTQRLLTTLRSSQSQPDVLLTYPLIAERHLKELPFK
jgi:hypothetical protein